ncbi:YbaY family lipoprotein [Nitratidesulfovibrio sp. SRB-5]|uniref:YbaY family lipoprotein n=1 Tax=Nitratidesulfovibrio sp. SRB-5 TaxID=2872636 RepID=UPI0010274917|nr:YbaY family lipoprotein [Nitratidesulfovibrio sp. SRB-5]MBZ2171946.1 YbaY family lipoprotein [Nitratidesulfovibrio sp. SRB-5]RXF78572.1 hypothetical protein EKK70_00890 [Desulfovibrio sp. DS-1]
MNDDCKTMTRRNRSAARGLSALVALLVLAALLAGCSEKLQLYRPGALAMVTGTVSFRQRILLPLSVQGEVRLLDVTDGGEGVELARVELPAPVRVPAPYRIDFDAARIDQRRNYVVEATLFEPGTGGGPGRVWFRTPTPQYVLTHGNPVYLELMLEMVR